ncbi:MAG: HlyD family secretion protein [Chlamydiales bacterium]|jgi:HlyD family secretion protein
MASGPGSDVHANTAGASAPAAGQRGVIVPGEHAAISLWPEAYSGELLVLEVRPEGTPVVEGDVLAQLDTRSIEEQIASASLEFDSARIAHEGLLEKNRIAQEVAAADLARAQTNLDRARHTLDGYENHELGFLARADGISGQREQYRVDDQQDELAQLEAMYTADELTDATEEIVLKRSRRGLQLTLDNNALSAERRQYLDDFARRNELEARREAIAKETQMLEHLVRSQASAQAARADAELRSTAGGAKKEERLQRLTRDLELFTIKAPRAGVLLHGKLADYRPGRSHARLERASKIGARANVLMVVEPGKLAVALELSESATTSLADGTAVRVRPSHGVDQDWTGQLTVSPYPTGHKGAEAIFTGSITPDGATPGWVIGTQVSVEAVAATQ